MEKPGYKTLIILGLGFLGIMMVWTLYNSFVPILLRGFIASNALIGLVMTFDNILAVTVQPIVGAISDRTRTRLGRRRPYMVFGAPLAALFFAMIPSVNQFWFLIVVIVLMNFFMAVFRAPVIALMPDITPSSMRSKANGVINFMGGVGALVALFAGGALFDVDTRFPFWVIAVVMAAAVFAVVFSIKEPLNVIGSTEDNVSWRLIKISFFSLSIGAGCFLFVDLTGFFNGLFSSIFNSPYQGKVLLSILIYSVFLFVIVLKIASRDTIFIFLSIFFWFFAYNGVETFFTLYGTKTLGLKAGQASMILGVFSLAFILFAIPSGFIATRLGRKKMILAGLSLLMGTMALMGFANSVLPLIILMFIGGAAWSAININAYPMICDLSSPEMLGTYTGLYYFFSMLAQTVSPPIVGVFVDQFGTYRIIFFVLPVFFLLAFIAMLFSKGGEAVRMTKSEILEQMDV